MPMIKRTLLIVVIALGALVLVPIGVAAAAAPDALSGLNAVLQAMIQAYIEFLKAVA